MNNDDKKRGVAKGTKRPIYFFCVAQKEGKLVKERVKARSEERARTLFQDKHSLSPEIAEGPFYEVRDASLISPGVDIDLTKVQYTKREWKGQFKGFDALFKGIDGVQGFGADELGLLVLGDAPPGSGLRKPRFPNNKPLVRRTALTNIEPA